MELWPVPILATRFIPTPRLSKLWAIPLQLLTRPSNAGRRFWPLRQPTTQKPFIGMNREFWSDILGSGSTYTPCELGAFWLKHSKAHNSVPNTPTQASYWQAV